MVIDPIHVTEVAKIYKGDTPLLFESGFSYGTVSEAKDEIDSRREDSDSPYQYSFERFEVPVYKVTVTDILLLRGGKRSVKFDEELHNSTSHSFKVPKDEDTPSEGDEVFVFVDPNTRRAMYVDHHFTQKARDNL